MAAFFETDLLALFISKLANVKFEKEQILDELRSEQRALKRHFVINLNFQAI